MFAGVFRGYGNLVILELPNKNHVLISGMAKISAEIGDEVLQANRSEKWPLLRAVCQSCILN